MTNLSGSALVKKIREISGWSQRRLADELGKDVRTVGRWDRDEYEPRAEDYRRLVALLDRLQKKRG